MTGEGIGFGKAILFNEHFVVYGVPAIVSAIGKYTVAKVTSSTSSKISINDNRDATPNYLKEKLSQQQESLKRILKKMNIEASKNSIKIELCGNLYASSGIGASAASCVAITRALSKHFNLNLSDEEINQIAYEGEKGYHGNPSGIDNTASTYGGLIWFEKTEPNVIERISIPNPVRIVMGNTGKVADTTAAIEGVRRRKEEYPEKYKKIFDRSENIAYLAKRALKEENYNELGSLLNENHKLLQQIEVSSKELDFLVSIAREQGALGAKLTGGGLGGNIIALTPGKNLQENVANAIEKEGFTVIKTMIGVESESVK